MSWTVVCDALMRPLTEGTAATMGPTPATPAGGPSASLKQAGGELTRNHVVALGSLAVNVVALYDIHGNLDALEAVLADPRAARPDVVVVGGDAVPGPFARATLDRLDALEVPVRWVRGNGEREVAGAVGAPPPVEDDLVARFAAIPPPSWATSGRGRSAATPTSRTTATSAACAS